MGKVTMKIDDWQRAMDDLETDDQRAPMIGASPGGTAEDLGITRQRVHQLIAQGRLDVVELLDRENRLLALMITDESMKRYKKEREENSGFFRKFRMGKN